ncbi:uncharacterized protein LOC128960025 [Oppia nitens]|uniref:uncharacterized protein LOC128960025 n=1 Tax=Oppia nitens TaxID=1686743 RepID=UPI0023D9D965|nr:uncharacterized protein LOC128960025 [Oppia nitens]
MFRLTIVLLVQFLVFYSVFADPPETWDCDDKTKCCCGGQLGLICAKRLCLDQNEPDGIPILRGQCKSRAFYQCSSIDEPAVFKGLCPNCRISEPGVDKCLTPTFSESLIKFYVNKQTWN